MPQQQPSNEPYQSLAWMWDDVVKREPGMADSMSGKHAKMFFALGACAFFMVQKNNMLQVGLDDEEGCQRALFELQKEATYMLHNAKEEFKNHTLPKEGLSGA